MAFDMPRANKPEDVGLSSQRLQRIRDTLQADVDKGAVPGAVMLIARRGQIASFEALGYRDREDGAVMRPDTIFRIASMTKPVTSVAAMMLAEEGKLLIADPVSRYIPAFANLKVATNSDDATAKTLAVEPPQREMTVQDLLRSNVSGPKATCAVPEHEMSACWHAMGSSRDRCGARFSGTHCRRNYQIPCSLWV
jgi:CubicO group peptidase (beta-lactamase class C family)